MSENDIEEDSGEPRNSAGLFENEDIRLGMHKINLWTGLGVFVVSGFTSASVLQDAGKTGGAALFGLACIVGLALLTAVFGNLGAMFTPRDWFKGSLLAMGVGLTVLVLLTAVGYVMSFVLCASAALWGLTLFVFELKWKLGNKQSQSSSAK